MFVGNFIFCIIQRVRFKFWRRLRVFNSADTTQFSSASRNRRTESEETRSLCAAVRQSVIEVLVHHFPFMTKYKLLNLLVHLAPFCSHYVDALFVIESFEFLPLILRFTAKKLNYQLHAEMSEMTLRNSEEVKSVTWTNFLVYKRGQMQWTVPWFSIILPSFFILLQGGEVTLISNVRISINNN